MLISFVIPVYNVEKYLNECVDSILAQDFKDYEIILVDDGSPDNSGAICDEYADKYDFISVIHKKNGGQSDARNVGLKAAKGDYILFVDSDDYIGKGSLKKMAQCVYDSNGMADVIFLEAFKVFPNGKVISLGDGYIGECINGCSKKSVIEHLASLPKYPGSACSKMVKRKLITDNNIFFESGIISLEDIDWTLSAILKSEVYAYCSADYYYYRQSRAGSVTNSIGLKNVQDMIYVIKKWISKNDKQPYQREINAFMAYEYMISLYTYSTLSKGNKKIIKDDIRAYSWILNYSVSKKTKLVKLFYKMLGLRLTATALKLYYKV